MIILAIIVIALIALDSRKKPAAVTMTARQTQAEIKRQERAEREEERRQAQEGKQRQKAAQAAEDIPFYETQLERLYPTAETLRYNYKLACDSVLHDAEMNMYGAVIKDKLVNEHIAQRDKLMRKLITVENQIHTMERRQAQAISIISI